MPSLRALLSPALALLFLVVGVRSAAAQARPFRGLFGGAQPMNTRGPQLDFSGSAISGWDRYPNGVPSLPDDPRISADNRFSGFSGALDFTNPGDHLSFGGHGSGFLGYFPERPDDPWHDSYSASGDISAGWDLSRRTRLNLHDTTSYRTDYINGLDFLSRTPGPGTPGFGPTSFDYGIGRAPSIDTAVGADLSRRLGSRSDLSVNYGYRRLFYLSEESAFRDSEYHTAGIHYSRGLTRYATMRAGYQYTRSVLIDGGQEPTSFHNIDLGVNYARALSLSRRTTFSFSTGAAAVTSGTVASDSPLFDRIRFTAIGNASLEHEIGRTWTLDANYARGLDYEPTLGQPYLHDTASVGLVGLLARRLDFSSEIRYTSASIGLTSRNYSSWVATSQLRGAIVGSLAAFASYYYYWYRVPART